MQDFLAKYGLAAHLALVAVAPLFLFPFFGASDCAGVLFALSLFAAFWILFSPTRLKGEQSYEARARVVQGIACDPLFWALVAVVLYASTGWLNTGVGMEYDAEAAVWRQTTAFVPFLPGSVSGQGSLPAAGALALLVVVTGVRQALGRSARATFLYCVALFSGLAALADLAAWSSGASGAERAVLCAWTASSYAGTGFALSFLAGLVSLELAFEEGMRRRIFLNAFALGACAAGFLFFMPLEVAFLYLLAAVALILLAVVRLAIVRKANDVFKYLSVLLLASLVPVLSIVGMASGDLLTARGAVFARDGFFPENWLEIRGILDALAREAWKSAPWFGTGAGSFALDLRFGATPADWAVLPADQTTALNGWWQILAETGVLGLLCMLLAPAFLLFTWVRRLCASFAKGRITVLPAVLGVFAVALVWAEAFATASLARPEVDVLACALLAVGGKAFPLPSHAMKRPPEKQA